jgi:predicted PurR-regulated permease PerM
MPKINLLLNNQAKVISILEIFSRKIEVYIGFELFTNANAASSVKSLVAYLPSFLNSTLNILSNLIMLFFLLYFLLCNGVSIESYIKHIIPLKPKNVEKIATETELMIRANALGIPLICLVQGVFATIGYAIFGLKDWGIWGFLTGILAFFPLIGTMVVWTPLVIYLYATNHNLMATGLMGYSIIVTGNVDYISRLGLLKKIGNVHPLITVFGVIVGLKLFGFIGLIFGPLLISYFILLIKIYINEFTVH